MLPHRRQFLKQTCVGLGTLAIGQAFSDPNGAAEPQDRTVALHIAVSPRVSVFELGCEGYFIECIADWCGRDVELIRSHPNGALLDRTGAPILSNTAQTRFVFITGNIEDSEHLRTALGIAVLAKERGMQVAALAPISSPSPGAIRMPRNMPPYTNLKNHVDGVIALPPMIPDYLTVGSASAVFRSVVTGLSDAGGQTDMALCLNDIPLRRSGSCMGFATCGLATGKNRGTKATKLALTDLEQRSVMPVTADAIVLISTATGTLNWEEMRAIVHTIRRHAPWGMNFTYGTAMDKALGADIKVSLLVAPRSELA